MRPIYLFTVAGLSLALPLTPFIQRDSVNIVRTAISSVDKVWPPALTSEETNVRKRQTLFSGGTRVTRKDDTGSEQDGTRVTTIEGDPSWTRVRRG